MIREMPVLDVIREKYSEIFQAEKKVADYILDNPSDVINSNVSELANKSDVSDATVIRLCKHLGYNGFYQMKICLSRDIGRQNVGSGEGNVESKESDIAAIAYSVVKSDNPTALASAADIIAKSRRTYICAAGNTAILTMYTGFRLERMGIPCNYSTQSEYFVNHINLANEDECVLAITRSGTSKSVVTAMELAKSRGLKVVVITAHRTSPASQIADVVLKVPVRGDIHGNEKYSRLEEMAVIDTLLKNIEDDIQFDEDRNIGTEILLSDKKY